MGDVLKDGTDVSEYSERELEVDFFLRREAVLKGREGRRYVGKV